MKQFFKKVKYASIWDNAEPDHWIAGKWFIGYIFTNTSMNGNTNKAMYILAAKKYYGKEVEGSSEEELEDSTSKTCKGSIKLLEREGNYFHLYYSARTIPATKMEPRDYQVTIRDQIIKSFEECNSTVVLLYGAPGKGKSMIPHFIAKKMEADGKKVHICDTFNPTEPGDTFAGLNSKVNPSSTEPLIIVLEEVDIIVTMMHNGIPPHKHIPIPLRTKADWDSMLDRFDRQLYPGVIFIMTSNKEPSFFDGLDPAYMRKGRFNLKIEV